MPTAADLLENAHRIANEAFALAVVWHAFVAAGAFAVMRGKANERRAGDLLTLLVASVSGVSFAFGNPFNGIIFAILALAMAVIARGFQLLPLRAGTQWSLLLGLAMMLLGWAYPEFVDKPGGWLYGAPLGLLPCPTLMFIIGATLFFNGFGSRAWQRLLSAVGLFYGVVGVLRLGVHVDAVLALGAATLGVQALLPAKPAVPKRRVAR